MTQKYDATVDYAKYLELAKEAKELEARIEELQEERRKFQEKVEEHLAYAREATDNLLIDKAAHELQVELMNKLNAAVRGSDDKEAAKLLESLKSHLSGKMTYEPEEAASATLKETPSVSPAIAAKKSVPQQITPPPAATSKKAPPPPPNSGKPGGQIIERRTLLNDTLNEICRYEYEDDELTRMVFLDAEGNPLRTHQMIYDKDGNLKQELHVDQAGRTLQVLERQQTKEGRIMKEIIRNSENELLNMVDFEYDSNGRLLKKEWSDAKKKRTKVWEYEYESGKKDPVRIVWRDERNKPYGQVELKYDEQGHIAKEISKDRTGDVIRSIDYQYFYG
ncbi:hypothetical protein JXM67_01085 [candidate division WOR-3 bacterium]|nr:hypothetical protein [candidate division WOR-3 bacterium]